MSIRELYCAAHFGNAYEAMSPREMAAYLAEMRAWGFNRYGDWLTATDIRSPFTTDALWDLGTELWDRKKQAYRAARALGFDLNAFVTPNHVYLDQWRPEWRAAPGDRIGGQLICPSIPAARQVILDNAERAFRDLAESRIRLDSLTASPYDYGGCGCDRCRPWVITFARLMREVHAIAERHHPAIEPWFVTWWWTPQEYALVADWARTEAPGWLKGMSLHIGYDESQLPEVPLPAGVRKLAFVHIGYGDTRRHGDFYAKWGPVVAPRRIPDTLAAIASKRAEGFQAYSEGIYDDCNKAILGGMSAGLCSDAAESLRQYARRYFESDDNSADPWADWISQWGDRTSVDLTRAAAEFESLARNAAPGWRVEQWRSKLELELLDRAIGRPKPVDWTPHLLALADRFWSEHERLTRDVYRLGPTRGILARRFAPPAWFESWAQATGQTGLAGRAFRPGI